MASEDVDTLTTYMQRAQDLLEGRQITLLIQGLEGYFRCVVGAVKSPSLFYLAHSESGSLMFRCVVY